MATRRYGISAGEQGNQVTEAVGAAVAADSIEVTVDLAGTALTKSDGKEKVINGLKMIIDHIVKGNWPPA